MVNKHTNLPARFRLGNKIRNCRANLEEKPFINNFGKSLRAYKGKKASTLLRNFFQSPKFKRLLGSNLAALLFTTSLLSQNTVAGVGQDEIFVLEAPLVLTTQTGVQFPVQNVKITQGYRFYHPGIDIDGITGDEIHPIMSGKIESIEHSKFGYGNSIVVNHGEGITSLYAHLSKISVKEGDEVIKSSKLGEMGATGWAKGDHLHLEIRDGGKPINPLNILPALR